MKFTLTLAPKRPLTRSEAWGCFTANLAMPGVGSLAAGKPVGYAQMALALLGLAISLATGINMIRWAFDNWARLSAPSDLDPLQPLIELWQHIRWPLAGLLIFGISATWAAITGWNLVSSAPKQDIPPKIQ